MMATVWAYGYLVGLCYLEYLVSKRLFPRAIAGILPEVGGGGQSSLRGTRTGSGRGPDFGCGVRSVLRLLDREDRPVEAAT